MGESQLPPAGPDVPKRRYGGDAGKRWSHWLAVAGGLGYVPVAPGTAGSLLGVLLFVGFAFGARAVGMGPLHVAADSFPPATLAWASVGLIYALGVALFFGVGVWASGRAEVDFDQPDDGRIVIDEVVGQLITLAPLLFFPVETPASSPSVNFPPSGPLMPGGSSISGGSAMLGGSVIPDGALTPGGVLSPGGALDLFPFFLWVVTGFVLFRLFDIWKPGAIRWAERRFEGGLGVMADDGVAGIHGAATLTASFWLIGSQVLGNRIGGLG